MSDAPIASTLYTAWIDPLTGEARCTCGAGPMGKGESKRFMRRHPSECTKRRVFNKALAQGVRCVEDQSTAVSKAVRRGFGEGE